MHDKAPQPTAVVKEAVYNVVMTDRDMDARITDAIQRLKRAQHVCCMSGAGISAESGVPTFRGAGGFWAGRRAEDLATPEAFERNPEEVWQFYLWRRSQLLDKDPNPGHHALAEIECAVPNFALITQNVDNLHQRAGSRNVIELHGNIWIDRCTACARENRPDQTPNAGAGSPRDQVPHCGECGRMMRPGVVWFGETLPRHAFAAAQEAAAQCDVMLVVGTSAVVQPAASLANWSQANGAAIIEINPDDTPLSPLVDIRFPRPAGQILPQIAQGLIQ